MVMQFGQFLDHDISLTPKDEVTNCCESGVQVSQKVISPFAFSM